MHICNLSNPQQQNFSGPNYAKLSRQGANTLSNILRIALIFLKGGLYLDLDNISIMPLTDYLPKEFVYMEKNHKLMLSLMQLRKGNTFLKVLLQEMVGSFRADPAFVGRQNYAISLPQNKYPTKSPTKTIGPGL